MLFSKTTFLSGGAAVLIEGALKHKASSKSKSCIVSGTLTARVAQHVQAIVLPSCAASAVRDRHSVQSYDTHFVRAVASRFRFLSAVCDSLFVLIVVYIHCRRTALVFSLGLLPREEQVDKITDGPWCRQLVTGPP